MWLPGDLKTLRETHKRMNPAEQVVLETPHFWGWSTTDAKQTGLEYFRSWFDPRATGFTYKFITLLAVTHFLCCEQLWCGSSKRPESKLVWTTNNGAHQRTLCPLAWNINDYVEFVKIDLCSPKLLNTNAEWIKIATAWKFRGLCLLSDSPYILGFLLTN